MFVCIYVYVPCERFTSNMKESRLKCMSHVSHSLHAHTHTGRTARNESRLICMSSVSYTAHTHERTGWYRNESHCEWVTSHMHESRFILCTHTHYVTHYVMFHRVHTLTMFFFFFFFDLVCVCALYETWHNECAHTSLCVSAWDTFDVVHRHSKEGVIQCTHTKSHSHIYAWVCVHHMKHVSYAHFM